MLEKERSQSENVMPATSGEHHRRLYSTVHCLFICWQW